MAPLKLRRDIGALGLLHKIQLGVAHPDFSKLFARKVGSFIGSTRHGMQRHGKQFEEIAGNRSSFNNSLFGAVHVYNILPNHIVTNNTVSAFQRLLTQAALSKCKNGIESWRNLYCCRHLV